MREKESKVDGDILIKRERESEREETLIFLDVALNQ